MTITAEFIKKFLQFINTADKNLAQELISPDAKFHVPGQPEPLQGAEGYLMIIGMMRSGFPDIQWTIADFVADGNKVAVHYTMKGTHNGTFFGVPASGKEINVHSMAFYELADGKIINEYGLPDMLSLMQQIGAVPAP